MLKLPVLIIPLSVEVTIGDWDTDQSCLVGFSDTAVGVPPPIGLSRVPPRCIMVITVWQPGVERKGILD